MLATLWQGAGMLKFCSVLIVAVGLGLSGCVKTSMQGYADRDLPSRTIQHLAVYVAAPGPLHPVCSRVLPKKPVSEGLWQRTPEQSCHLHAPIQMPKFARR